MIRFELGNFKYLCSQTPLPLCASLNLPDPTCYSRNLEVGRWLLLEPGNSLFVILIQLLPLFQLDSLYYKKNTNLKWE